VQGYSTHSNLLLLLLGIGIIGFALYRNRQKLGRK
jgi:hypothetical protein